MENRPVGSYCPLWITPPNARNSGFCRLWNLADHCICVFIVTSAVTDLEPFLPWAAIVWASFHSTRKIKSIWEGHSNELRGCWHPLCMMKLESCLINLKIILGKEQIFKQEHVIDLGKGKLGILQSVAMSSSALSHLFSFSTTVFLQGLASGAVSPYRC